MKIIKRQLRRIINESKGWFLLGLDGTLAKSQKTRTPIWWSDEAGAKKAYDSGYGGEGAVPVEILLAPDIYAYNGSDADPADLESVRQHWAPGTLNKLGESKMKITKRQLRKIIKEEKKRLLREQTIEQDAADYYAEHPYGEPRPGPRSDADFDDLVEDLKNVLGGALSKGLGMGDTEDAWNEAIEYIRMISK